MILVSGCSYTVDIYPFPVWPTLLAKKLDTEVINVASSGAGNDYIFSAILDKLVSINDSVDMVIVMWSEFQRVDFERKSQWVAMHHLRNNSSNSPWINPITDALIEHGIGFPRETSRKSLRTFYAFQSVMENSKIPFLQIVGTTPIPSYDEQYVEGKKVKYIAEDGMKEFIRTPYLDKIDDTKFLGWPVFNRIGGFCIDDKIDEWDSGVRDLSPKLRISAQDSHPNKKGHEHIAKYLYEKILLDGYKKNYS
mgnify:CR=1 FL=1